MKRREGSAEVVLLPDLLPGRARHVSEGHSGRMGGSNGDKLEHGEFQVDVWKKKYIMRVMSVNIMRVIKCFKRLPIELVESLSLQIFKTQLVTTVSNLTVVGYSFQQSIGPNEVTYNLHNSMIL